jgi:hypothetical protein
MQFDYGSGSNLWNVWITLPSRTGQKSRVNIMLRHKKDADDITPHTWKSIADKADACDIEGVKSLADNT